MFLIRIFSHFVTLIFPNFFLLCNLFSSLVTRIKFLFLAGWHSYSSFILLPITRKINVSQHLLLFFFNTSRFRQYACSYVSQYKVIISEQVLCDLERHFALFFYPHWDYQNSALRPLNLENLRTGNTFFYKIGKKICNCNNGYKVKKLCIGIVIKMAWECH